ncbi:MAG: hypothetical protein PHS14_18110 [Elusimicrobia bacterium]|nr:hypothetical protein [Elusimicrobiota bacterium]
MTQHRALFRVSVHEGGQELGIAVLPGTYEEDPTKPGEILAHLPPFPAALQAELDPIAHPGRTVQCDRIPNTPEESINDGFLKSLGGKLPEHCWACEEPARWQCVVRLKPPGMSEAGVWAVFFHCRDHRPGDVPITLNGVMLEVEKRPDSQAWALVQDTTRPTT